jgi:hypothetical protein
MEMCSGKRQQPHDEIVIDGPCPLCDAIEQITKLEDAIERITEEELELQASLDSANLMLGEAENKLQASEVKPPSEIGMLRLNVRRAIEWFRD